MSDPPAPPAADLEFDCPLCSGAFEISAEWLGHEVECPHCGGAVQLESAEEEPPPQEAAAELADSTAAEGAIEVPPQTETAAPPPAEPRTADPAPRPAPLTPAERAALRRRFNAALAIAGALLLVGTFLALSWFAQR